MKARASAARSSSGRENLAAEVGQKSLDPHQFQNRDEQLVALDYRAKLALKPREQLLLKGVPVMPIASRRRDTAASSSVVIMRCFALSNR